MALDLSIVIFFRRLRLKSWCAILVFSIVHFLLEGNKGQSSPCCSPADSLDTSVGDLNKLSIWMLIFTAIVILVFSNLQHII
ncbi:hypothetical protein DK880_00917 [Candidatus Cardinium hertigii]|uniref:Uncharacterized protein n=1 Tax=Candidatus Cardinium hertigii TaxID=247481 RepID=A0A2Z3LI60_9BACT|nr:hypothetical protein DK880_00917 [Candidatus Cardinium hertigii]